MDSTFRHLIEAIHQAPHKCVFALTGGGTSAAAMLLSIPGGSRTILEIAVPYHEEALVEFLGHRPAQSCSAATSRAIAARAYERALWLVPGDVVVGIGCTASLATDRPKRGEHRFYLGVRTANRIVTYSLTLRKGERNREAEEAVLDAVLLNALAEALEINERVPEPLLPGERVEVETSLTRDLVASLLRDEIRTVCVECDGRLMADGPRPAALIPGAFNPIHEGHCQLAAVAAEIVRGPVAFELSATNVDKLPLTVEEIRLRASQFAWHYPLWITRAPTFAEKASLFPQVVFVVGADTAERIVAPRYYQDSATSMAESLEHIRKQGCRFLVAGREDHTGRFVGVDELLLPEGCRDLFAGIPKDLFHVPISSTLLRERAKLKQIVAPPDADE